MPRLRNRHDGPDPASWTCAVATLTCWVQVRRWAATELADLGEDHLADVMLVAIELVTNAYDHGNGPRMIRLTPSPELCMITVEVGDSNTVEPVLGVSRFGVAANRGRGMTLVDRISECWGVVLDAGACR
jgi:anti-sigma regulatory factor (Ser/Thr protein kinase)